MFNFENIDDFDKHINLSIPNYSGLIDVIRPFVLEYLQPMGLHVDIGCSTGALVHLVSNLVPNALSIGIDEVDIFEFTDCQFEQVDFVDYLEDLKSCDFITSIFSLQFLPAQKRNRAIAELRRLVNNGAVCVIAEKVYCSSSRVNTILHREHMRQKRKHFTDKEILDKDYELFGSMFCKNESEIALEVASIGKPVQIWQSYNFHAWIMEQQ